MNDIPEDDARAVMAIPRVCDEPSPWQIAAKPPGTWVFEQGLVDGNGERSGYVVHMIYSRSPKTKQMTISYGLFQQGRRGEPLTRIYQLHIKATAYHPQDLHGKAHEHIGSGRYAIAAWETWRGFNDSLAYFSQRANIRFVPTIDDPEEFKLQS